MINYEQVFIGGQFEMAKRGQFSRYLHYIQAGVLELSVMDKVKILLTPDASDLFSPKGIKQAKAIGAKQLDYYQDNLFFAAGQAIEFTNNIFGITKLVTAYCVKNAIDPANVWKLIKEWLF